MTEREEKLQKMVEYLEQDNKPEFNELMRELRPFYDSESVPIFVGAIEKGYKKLAFGLAGTVPSVWLIPVVKALKSAATKGWIEVVLEANKNAHMDRAIIRTAILNADPHAVENLKDSIINPYNRTETMKAYLESPKTKECLGKPSRYEEQFYKIDRSILPHDFS